MPHEDVLEQVIDYKVPPEKADELIRFDGSVMIERTKGELSARCQEQEANFLAINLAHRIVEGEMDVEEARKLYTNELMAFTRGEEAPLTQRFDFDLPTGDTKDPDEPSVSEEEVQQAQEEGSD